METKKRVLFEIDRDISEKKYNDAIEISYEGFKCFKDSCFLSKVVEVHQNTRNYKGAISVLKTMLKTEKDSEHILNKIANSYFAITKYRDALKYYKLLLEKNPKSSEYNFNVGCTYDFMKDYKKALQYYQFALDADSSNVPALNNYAMICYTKKLYDVAISILDWSIKIAPSHYGAYYHLGVIKREYNKDLDFSLLYLKKAYELNPQYALISYELALTYKAMNNIPSAIEYVKKSLEIDSSCRPALKLFKEL